MVFDKRNIVVQNYYHERVWFINFIKESCLRHFVLGKIFPTASAALVILRDTNFIIDTDIWDRLSAFHLYEPYFFGEKLFR